jgi:hypothetical protein
MDNTDRLELEVIAHQRTREQLRRALDLVATLESEKMSRTLNDNDHHVLASMRSMLIRNRSNLSPTGYAEQLSLLDRLLRR